MNHRDLAERYGTPLYVYDLDRVAEAQRDLLAALPEGFDLFYALKANPHPDLVRTLRPGCRAEISSTGELAAALAGGWDGADCLYTGPGKTEGELAEAVSRGVRLFSAESPTDLGRIGAAAASQGVVADCLLRVNHATAGTATGVRMNGTPSQFGFDAETLTAPDPVAGTRIVGCHFFPLSNAEDEDSLIAEFEHTIEAAAQIEERLGTPLAYLDIGGGFAAPYGVPGRRPRYPRLRAALSKVLDERFPRWRDGGLQVACESGRYLAADCGTLVTAVVNVKESRGRTFVVLDAGINAFGGMSGLGRLLPTAVRPGGSAEGEPVTLVGPLCTPGDVLGRDVTMPPPRPGEVLSVPNAGSYGVSASLVGFLGRPAPAEVAVRGGQVVSVSRLELRRT